MFYLNNISNYLEHAYFFASMYFSNVFFLSVPIRILFWGFIITRVDLKNVWSWYFRSLDWVGTPCVQDSTSLNRWVFFVSVHHSDCILTILLEGDIDSFLSDWIIKMDEQSTILFLIGYLAYHNPHKTHLIPKYLYIGNIANNITQNFVFMYDIKFSLYFSGTQHPSFHHE